VLQALRHLGKDALDATVLSLFPPPK
jgi:hypothetical protein